MIGVGKPQAEDVGLCLIIVASVLYACLRTDDPNILFMGVGVIGLLCLNKRRSKTIKCSVLEIVDESGYTRASIGITHASGLTIAVAKARSEYNCAVIPACLDGRPSVQYTFAANLGSTSPEHHQAPEIIIGDSERCRSPLVFSVFYRKDAPPNIIQTVPWDSLSTSE